MNKITRLFGFTFSVILGIGFGLLFSLVPFYIIFGWLLGYGDSGPTWVLIIQIYITILSVIFCVVYFTKPFFIDEKNETD